MKRLFVIGVLAVFLFGIAGIANAEDLLKNVEVKITCPASVTAGTALNVQALFYNWNCSSISVWRIMKGLGGNANDTLGGIGLYGPFPQAVSYTLPAASCPFGYPESPGKAGWYNIQITSSVPTALANSMGMASVAIMRNNGKVFGGDACVVSIVP